MGSMNKPLYTVMGRYAHKPGWYPSSEVMTSVGAQMEAERANLSAYFLYPEGSGKMQGRIRKSEPRIRGTLPFIRTSTRAVVFTHVLTPGLNDGSEAVS
jgi:hypothetical protein